MRTQCLLPVADSSQVSAARRAASELAGQLDFSPTDVGRVALLVTEAATNLLKHAGSGEIVLRQLDEDAPPGLEILVLDRGAGIANLEQSLRDGFSTAGSPGTGLGAMRRLASEFHAYSLAGKGFAMRLTLRPGMARGRTDAVSWGVLSLPMRGEDVCGDAWTVDADGGRRTFMVADGLGHGPLAHQAAIAATGMLGKHSFPSAARLIEDAHLALRATRGAAVAVACLDADDAELSFAGVGNISASVTLKGTRRQLVSHSGIVGHNVRKVQEFKAGWGPEAVLIMHSDGLATHWNLEAYPGLLSQHPALIAGVLYRDFARGRDDVTVLVAKQEQ